MDDTERQYRALLAAVVLRAIHDAHHGNGSQQHSALIFLRSQAMENACSWLYNCQNFTVTPLYNCKNSLLECPLDCPFSLLPHCITPQDGHSATQTPMGYKHTLARLSTVQASPEISAPHAAGSRFRGVRRGWPAVRPLQARPATGRYCPWTQSACNLKKL